VFFDSVGNGWGNSDVVFRQHGEHRYQGSTIHYEVRKGAPELLYNFLARSVQRHGDGLTFSPHHEKRGNWKSWRHRLEVFGKATRVRQNVESIAANYLSIS